MRSARACLILAALAVALPPLRAATVDELVERNRHTLDGVRDFTCLLTFSVKSPSVRVPPSRAKLYFKQPDKFKAKPLDGDVTVLPRTWRFAVGSLLARLSKDHKLATLREESLDGRAQQVVKAVPKAADDQASYHLLWVDAERYTVTQVRTYPKHGPPASVKLTYQRHDQAWLPASAEAEGTAQRKGGGDEKFAVSLKFTGYEVNTGLSDAVFEEPRKGQ